MGNLGLRRVFKAGAGGGEVGTVVSGLTEVGEIVIWVVEDWSGILGN